MSFHSPAIDVETGDYTLTDGELEDDATVASEAILAWRSRKRSCALAPEYGSEFHRITKITAQAPRLAEDHGRRAWQFLVDRGSMRDLKVTASIVSGRLQVLGAYRDRSGQIRTIPYTHVVTG